MPAARCGRPVHRPAGHVAALHHLDEGVHGDVSRTASASTAPRSAASRRSTSRDMLLMPTPRPRSWTRAFRCRRSRSRATSRTRSAASGTRATRATWRARRGVPLEERRGGRVVLGPEAEFFIFKLGALRRRSQRLEAEAGILEPGPGAVHRRHREVALLCRGRYPLFGPSLPEFQIPLRNRCGSSPRARSGQAHRVKMKNSPPAPVRHVRHAALQRYASALRAT